jgi:hypothetical protein
MPLTRREMLGLSLATVLWPMLPQAAEAKRFVNRTGLRRGQFVWEPTQPLEGPVTIVASLRDRLVHVYKAGILIGISTSDVGYRGRRTPTGVFALAERKVTNGGDFSWTGYALHADHVGGYPASLGCIRLPSAFARLLDSVAGPGTLVILARQRTEPVDVVHSGTLFPAVPIYEAGRLVRTVAVRSMPELLTGSPVSGHVAIVVSRSGGNAILLRDGLREHIARVTFAHPDRRIGTHVYSLTGTSLGGHELVWLAFGIGRDRREPHLVSWHGDEILGQISFEDRAEAMAMARLLHTGATLVITDELATSRKHQTPEDFVLISTQGSKPQPSYQRRRRRRRARATRRRQRWASALFTAWR